MTHRIVIIGSGPSGMTAALLLARQGHEVTLVDRDPGPIAGRPWERVGVMQFQLPHSFRSPGRRFLAHRLPDVHDALVDAGGILDADPGMPPEAAGMHIRRSVLERTIWELTSREPGVQRMVGHVDEVLVERGRACSVVVDGVPVPADLVVDASGRAGGLSDAHRPAREGGSCGMAYAARQFQLLPGAQPGPTNGGPGVMTQHGGFMQLVFVHDSGTFTVLIVRAARDRELAELRHEAAYDAALAVLPEASTWTDPARAHPIDHVRAGAGLNNHYQGQPTHVRGLLAIGDAVCTTNPAGARGLSFGMQMAGALSDVIESRPSASGRPRSRSGATTPSGHGSTSTSSPTRGSSTSGAACRRTPRGQSPGPWSLPRRGSTPSGWPSWVPSWGWRPDRPRSTGCARRSARCCGRAGNPAGDPASTGTTWWPPSLAARVPA